MRYLTNLVGDSRWSDLSVDLPGFYLTDGLNPYRITIQFCRQLCLRIRIQAVQADDNCLLSVFIEADADGYDTGHLQQLCFVLIFNYLYRR